MHLHTTGEEQEPVERTQLRPTIRIPPRTHYTCTLCAADYTIPPSDVLDPPEPSIRCLPCQKCEKCSSCKKIKKKKRFRKDSGTDTLFKTCNVCRERDTMRIFQKRAQALSLGMSGCIQTCPTRSCTDVPASPPSGLRWCSARNHQVSVEDCQDENGEIYALCRACLNHRAQIREGAAAAIAEERQFAFPDAFEATLGDDAAEGVDATVVDEFDTVFGNGADLTDVNLPNDTTVSA